MNLTRATIIVVNNHALVISMENQIKSSCPTCNKPDTWKVENVYKPFCCSRCKLIDLGEWANESRIIAGHQLSEEDLEENLEIRVC